MTDYRLVARHVRYWRGVVHRWSTVYPLTGTIASGDYGTVIAALKTLEQGVNFQDPAPAPTRGGLYEIALYDQATGGVPIAVSTYFDWTTFAAWVPYTSAGWATAGRNYEAAAEVSLAVRWAAGLSRTGKPVYFRKWYHAVPTSSANGTRDVGATDVTNLTGIFTAQMAVIGGKGALLGNGGRLAALSPTVELFYENHQMPRGRRRKGSTASVPSGAAVQGPFKILLD